MVAGIIMKKMFVYMNKLAGYDNIKCMTSSDKYHLDSFKFITSIIKQDNYLQSTLPNLNPNEENFLDDEFIKIISDKNNPLKFLDYLNFEVSGQEREICLMQIFRKIPVGLMHTTMNSFGFKLNKTYELMGFSADFKLEKISDLDSYDVVNYMMDKNRIMMDIVDNLKAKLNDSKTRFNSLALASKVTLMVEMNYIKMVKFLYDELKVTPLIMPEPLNEKFSEKYLKQFIKEEKSELNKNKNEYKKLGIPPIKVFIDNPMIVEDSAFKEHYLFSSYLKTFNSLMNSLFSDDSDFINCFSFDSKYDVGDRCPIYMKEYISFLSSQKNIRFKSTIILNIFTGVFNQPIE